ncbi:hypothetical protein [Comamonas sp. AG1104]|uniref:hypothetical protein n=1 Tax=Comamonas sp. AG1104 TaxID=2183900 RepID=UPI000E2B86B9|nr:hypothetical protein [Comamonas sp. AG1104]RDI06593.1 hypothetical protein DFO48_11232 [Comamonas sp. AG1104]
MLPFHSSRPSTLRWLCTGVVFTAGWLVATLARADYLWIQPEANGAKVFAGELRKPLESLPVLRDAKAVLPEANDVPYEQVSDHFGVPKATGDMRFTATHTSTDGVLTYYQARFGRTETKSVNDLELVPTEPGGNTYQLIFKGRPVAASQVNVDTSEGWHRTLTPAKDGTVSFVPYIPGLYVLEVTARINNGSVTLNGKKYDDVRHTATLSFEVPR